MAREPRAGGDGKPTDIPPVVGVGASAGGLDAYSVFVEHIPQEAGIAWVLIQHMAPDRESHLAELLSHRTALPVTQVTEDMPVAADHIYVIAPGRIMTIRDGVLRSVPERDPNSRRGSIDAFLMSLAEDRGERSGCALLSGAGTDGTIGLKAVKEAGGLTATQAPGVAEYDSMLLSAVRTGLVDRELALEAMAPTFRDFLVNGMKAAGEHTVGDGERLHVCRVLRAATGHDFSGYKSSTVDRRIRRRMQMLGITGLADYVRRLEEDRPEATMLFRDLLIGVTQFFRDPEAFTAIGKDILPKILAGKTADDEIRVWAAGCATGEEAYSLAMMLQEQALSLDSVPSFRIFGSDIDEASLYAARLGRYPSGIAADVSPQRLSRFFEQEDGTYRVRDELREICLFAQHNILRDSPFSRIDLLVCRNLMIYMNGDLQNRLMPVFHYALRPGGYLFLGPAESAASHIRLFEEVSRHHRVYRRIGQSGHLPEFPVAEGEMANRPRRDRRAPERPEYPDGLGREVERRILDHHAPRYVVIDSEFEIIELSHGTGDFLELPAGRPRYNLAAMARSGLAIDVRATVAKVMASGQPAARAGITVGAENGRKNVTLLVEPLPRPRDGGGPLYLVVFKEALAVDTSLPESLATAGDDEVARALELELQTTKKRLQSALEELETSNEELKVSNEELSSTNEELQSSNEELETSREELQSINEELRTVNNELGSRVEELSRANNDLKNLFANTEIAMLFLDRDLRIMNFTPPARPLFRLRDHDIGRPLEELSGRIDHESLKSEVKAVLRDGRRRETEVRTEGTDGRTFIMRILPYCDADERIQGTVLAFIDISERKASEERLATMVSELNHRVKNSLAGVQAIVRQTQLNAPTVKDFAETVQGRIQAMAASHHIISESDWKHADFEQLARYVLGPFAEADSGRLILSGPRIQTQSRAALTMGMILHELATNASKYGAWSAPQGAVTMRWEFVRRDGHDYRVIWTETGGPPPPKSRAEGFGLTFIRRSTEFDLRGTCKTEFRRTGLRCIFTLPDEKFIAASEDDA